MEIADMSQPEMLEQSSSAKKAAGRKRKGITKSPSAAIDLEGSELLGSPRSETTATPKREKMRLNSSSRKKSAENNSSESTEKAAGEHTGARKLFMYL